MALISSDILKQDPFSRYVLVFMNAKRTSCKCLDHDGAGFVIVAKRLEKDTFAKINPYYDGDIVLSQAEFSLFFEGADLRKRFIESPRSIDKKVSNCH